MYEARRHHRVREDVPVTWRTSDQQLEGRGAIRNISESGFLLEAQGQFHPDEDEPVVVRPDARQDETFIPPEAKVIWFRKVVGNETRFLCGMKFVAPDESVVARLAQRVERKRMELAQATNVNILENYVI